MVQVREEGGEFSSAALSGNVQRRMEEVRQCTRAGKLTYSPQPYNRKPRSLYDINEYERPAGRYGWFGGQTSSHRCCPSVANGWDFAASMHATPMQY